VGSNQEWGGAESHTKVSPKSYHRTVSASLSKNPQNLRKLTLNPYVFAISTVCKIGRNQTAMAAY
jgi:hypothetical protein